MDAPSLAALIDAIKRRFGGGDIDEQAAAARQGAEQLAGTLPDAVMPRGALEEQRRRLQMIDELARSE